jgi:hypothetical protein
MLAGGTGMGQVLARCLPEERRALEQTLEAASFAIFQARQALGPAPASFTSLTAWRASLHTAMDACAVAEGMFAGYTTADDPRP